MASEQFSLCWDNFHKNMSSGMNSLLENEDLVDVTLAVEGRILKAHKMVLSVCSPYFKDLFKTNPCKHPIVFMKDVSYVAMSDLLQFMYQGEVQVSQENLSSFIKTAEALQIKGLTGDGNNTTDTEFEEPQQPETVEIVQPKPARSKKQPSTTLQSPSGPAIKKPRLNESEPIPNKVEYNNSTALVDVTESAVQYKVEPYDQKQTIVVPDDAPVETFEDETFINDNLDEHDTEEYSMIEGGEEPQAGTSNEMAAGEGQDEVKTNTIVKKSVRAKKKQLHSRMRFVSNGFIYHNNVVAGSPKLRYLGCADHKKSGCRGRATVPVGAPVTQLRMTQPHNHPPDYTAEERDMFVNELRRMTVHESMRSHTLKTIYETVADLYPNGASEISFKSINSSLFRWRKRAIELEDE